LSALIALNTLRINDNLIFRLPKSLENNKNLSLLDIGNNKIVDYKYVDYKYAEYNSIELIVTLLNISVY
jgi:Leucine-rich repeat (LRR) protein